MVCLRTVLPLLVLICLGWSKPSYAQQAPFSATEAVSRPLLTAADTVAALQDLFQAKRKSSGWFLAAAPVALGLTMAGAGLASVIQYYSRNPSTVPPLIILGGGVTGTVLLLQRCIRYTKGNEQEVLSRYQRTHRLPGWVARNLAKHRAAKP